MVATKCTSNPYLLGQECGISHLYIHEVPTKHPREIFLDLQNANVKKFPPTKYPQEKKLYPQKLTRKNLDPRNTHEKKILNSQNTN